MAKQFVKLLFIIIIDVFYKEGTINMHPPDFRAEQLEKVKFSIIMFVLDLELSI